MFSRTVLAAAVVGLVALPAQAQAAPIPFSATSGDNCPYGLARGTLEWRVAPGPTPVPPPAAVGAAISGTLTDRPLPVDPSICRDDGLYSIATFVAYNGNQAVARDARRADNATVQYAFTLTGSTATPRINLVVIQVCRHRATSTAPAYCGREVRIAYP
jgi:hypothetical protein